jgi:hypothetical protein
MSDLPPQPSGQPPGEGWWKASDGQWYPPESRPAESLPPPSPETTSPVPSPAEPSAPIPPSAEPTPAVPPPGAHPPIGRARSVGLTILVSIVTLGIWTWVWSYSNGEELNTYRRDGLGGVAYLLLTIFISPVTMFLLASEVERLYTDEGEPPRITAVWGLWFLLPLIGNIIWYVRIQRAINEFWQARGSTPSPGLT